MAKTKKERIIEVAERLFAERGFDGVSLREITRAAGSAGSNNSNPWDPAVER